MYGALGLQLFEVRARAPSNRRLEWPGASAGLSVAWLEGSMTKSCDQTVRQVGWSARRSSARR
jgi:hypothetical protein